MKRITHTIEVFVAETDQSEHTTMMDAVRREIRDLVKEHADRGELPTNASLIARWVSENATWLIATLDNVHKESVGA